MRTALVTGVVIAAAVAVIGWGHTLSNADFIYMCCSARRLADGGWPVSAYFPAGYPMLLCLLIQAGFSALTAGALLSALGTGLSAAALAWTARRLKLPVILAVAFGLLGATLPDVFEIALNPHVDALYTGLGLWVIALALALLSGDRRRLLIGLLICALVLLTLRYHAVVALLPVALVLVFSRQPARRAGALLLVAVLVVSGLNYGAQYAATGAVDTAFRDQVRTGYVTRTAEGGVESVYADYNGFLATAPRFNLGMVAANIGADYPDYLERKAVLLGVWLWLLALLVRRYPPHSLWLALFVFGYPLAVSAAYFTPRASALPELAALLLAVYSLASLYGHRISPEVPEATGPPAAQLPRRPVSTFALVAALVLVAAAGYNGWREAPLVRQWRRQYAAVLGASRQALKLAGGHREQVYGAMDYTAWPLSGRYNLPAACYSRYWLDDPRIAQIVTPYIQRYTPEQVLTGDSPVGVVLLWERHGARPSHPWEPELIKQLQRSLLWHEVLGDVDDTRLWVQGG